MPPTAAVDAHRHLPVIEQRVNDLPAGMPPQMKIQCTLGTLGATICTPGRRRTPQRACRARRARTSPITLKSQHTGPAHRVSSRDAAQRAGNGFRGADADWLAALRAPILPNGVPRATRIRDAGTSLTEVGCADAAAAPQSLMLSRGAMRGGYDPDFRDRYQGMYWLRPRRTYLRLHIAL